LVNNYYSEKSGKPYDGVAVYDDYRELLQNRDLDAVLISTPDHWHAMIGIQAVEAGKDVYLQKPAALTIAEGRALSDAEISALANPPIGLASGRPRTASPIRLSGVTRLENGRIRLGISGSPNLAARILASDDLIHWTEIGAVIISEDGTADFVDSAGAGQPARFYKVIVP